MTKLPPPIADALLKRFERIVVFSGAGMSVESGIATFRGAQDGLWARFNPTELATPRAWREQRNTVWAWYEWRRAQVLAAAAQRGPLGRWPDCSRRGLAHGGHAERGRPARARRLPQGVVHSARQPDAGPAAQLVVGRKCSRHRSTLAPEMEPPPKCGSLRRLDSPRRSVVRRVTARGSLSTQPRRYIASSRSAAGGGNLGRRAAGRRHGEVCAKADCLDRGDQPGRPAKP